MEPEQSAGWQRTLLRRHTWYVPSHSLEGAQPGAIAGGRILAQTRPIPTELTPYRLRTRSCSPGGQAPTGMCIGGMCVIRAGRKPQFMDATGELFSDDEDINYAAFWGSALKMRHNLCLSG